MNRSVFNKLLVVCCSNDDLFWEMRGEGSQHNHMVCPVFSGQAFGYGAFIVWYTKCWLSEDKDVYLREYGSISTEEELTDLVEYCQMYGTFLKRVDTEVFQKSTSTAQLIEASCNLLKGYCKDSDSAWLAFWTLENTSSELPLLASAESRVSFLRDCWEVCQEPCTHEYKTLDVSKVQEATGLQIVCKFCTPRLLKYMFGDNLAQIHEEVTGVKPLADSEDLAVCIMHYCNCLYFNNTLLKERLQTEVEQCVYDWCERNVTGYHLGKEEAVAFCVFTLIQKATNDVKCKDDYLECLKRLEICFSADVAEALLGNYLPAYMECERRIESLECFTESVESLTALTKEQENALVYEFQVFECWPDEEMFNRVHSEAVFPKVYILLKFKGLSLNERIRIIKRLCEHVQQASMSAEEYMQILQELSSTENTLVEDLQKDIVAVYAAESDSTKSIKAF